ESRSRRRQPDAVGTRAALRQAGAVVADLERQPVAIASRADLDASRSRLRAHAVPDRVLDDRLQHEIGHERAERRRLDVVGDLEAVVEACALDLQVERKYLEL